MVTNMSNLSEAFRLFSPVGIALSGGLLIVFIAAYVLYTLVYNLFFHPLKHIPGPLLARASGIPYALRMRNGSMVAWIKLAHDKYGDAVRLNPNEVSFISGETAWPDIYSFRTGQYKNTGSYLKDRTWYLKPANDTWSLLGANDEDHSRMRRTLAHAFSDKALREQEPLIQQYVDLLVHRLSEHATEDKPVDIMRWYNYTTFDIICDLTFGEPLYCLRDSKEHIWINLVFAAVKAVGLASVRAKNPLFAYYDKALDYFKNTAGIARMRLEFYRLAREKVGRRLDNGTDRHDFFSYITKNQESKSKAISRNEMDSTAVLFLAAGSETTATTLTGVTYLLLSNPSTYASLVHIIRSTFSSASAITIEAVNKLDYMNACLNEGLRYYPPVPTGFPRVVPSGGDRISGHYIPEGTSVYVSQHAANHSARNYVDPEMYVPERWLGEEKYRDDKRGGFNPFSFGPRGCLGKNLAYAELRLILAHLLFAFDLTLVDPAQQWMDGQKLFTLWEKPSLMVRLTPVVAK
ncbi:cytochrome P450 monooxygenase-like protein [Ophiobolus disseminans]|uniref:Cytochrome P450 monooxygenase-like protein n=1 Tax=Ophiobolus disseminans TaxID=1469910 RepID=A0A6A6ZH63_9PLEO|nr:cytochrome P450 monooxygenase-like protein [Ophiobolus disseminans]